MLHKAKSGHDRATFKWCSCPEFFQHLGYFNTQIREFIWDTEKLFSLGTLPLRDGGDMAAANLLDINAVSTAPCLFEPVPRPTDAYLRFEAYVTDLPVTPSSP